jgi:transcription antitermination protein NusB
MNDTPPPSAQSARGSKKARMSAARLAAVQALYRMMLNRDTATTVIREFAAYRFNEKIDDEDMVLPDGILFERIVKGLDMRRGEVELLVTERLGDRVPEPLLMSVLLCGAYELLAHTDIDAPIIIADYLHVTKAFYDKSEAGLVNAVLDALRPLVRLEG